MNTTVFALRNLARHPRRTILKIAGIAVITAVMMIWGTFSRGFSDLLERNAVSMELGDLQIHHPDYLQSENLYDFFEFTEDDFKALQNKQFIGTPRLYGNALAAAGENSAGISLRGLDIEREAQVTQIHTHLDQGQWLAPTDREGVVVGFTLAKILNLKIGDELIVMGQAADGSLAAEKYSIQGILKLINQSVDRRGVFLTEGAFREFFQLADGFHEIAIKSLIDNDPSLQASEEILQSQFPSQQIVTWRDRKPVLARIIDIQSITILFTLSFIYFALGGLILNSMIMTIYDRMVEYGIMKAIGMSPLRIFSLIFAESVWLSFLGGLIALVLGVSAALYLEKYGFSFSFIVDRLSYSGMTMEPILYGQISLRALASPLVFLLIMMPLATLYPAIKAARVVPIDAIHGR